jgi:hypothetical protein
MSAMGRYRYFYYVYLACVLDSLLYTCRDLCGGNNWFAPWIKYLLASMSYFNLWGRFCATPDILLRGTWFVKWATCQISMYLICRLLEYCIEILREWAEKRTEQACKKELFGIHPNPDVYRVYILYESTSKSAPSNRNKAEENTKDPYVETEKQSNGANVRLHFDYIPNFLIT